MKTVEGNQMLIKTEFGELLLTEIKNINGSLDDDSRLKERIIKQFIFFGKDSYGILVQERNDGILQIDGIHHNDAERHKELFNFFEKDKDDAIKYKHRMSIFLIRPLI